MKRYEQMRKRVQNIEEKLKAIVNEKSDGHSLWYRSERKCLQIEKLVWQRKKLLDKMFTGTPDETARRDTACLTGSLSIFLPLLLCY